MNSQNKPLHQETIAELVARLVMAFEKKQAVEQKATQPENPIKPDIDS